MNHFVAEDGDAPPFTKSLFDTNQFQDYRTAERQPSYLLAVGAVSQPSAVFDAAKELHVATHRSHTMLPQFEFGTSRQRYVSLQLKDTSIMNIKSHISPVGQQAARFIYSEPYQKGADSRCQQPVNDFADEGLLHAADSKGINLACIQNRIVNCNPNGPNFMNVKSNFQSDINNCFSEMAPAQTVRHVPKAVIAPMSQTDLIERPYPIDKFSSLPKMLKSTCRCKRDLLRPCVDDELATSKSCGAIVPASDKFAVAFHTNPECGLTDQHNLGSGHRASSVYCKPLLASEHSGIVSEQFERLHPSCGSTRSSDVGKSKTFDDIDDRHGYIRPQTVESVLSYQNLARKSVGSCSQRAVISGVTSGNSMPPVANSHTNRKLAYKGMRPNCHPSNEMVSMPFPSEVPPERKCIGDRRSASSTSTTCSSQLDSGYSGDRCHSASLTSTCQSPELCYPGSASYPFSSCRATDMSLSHSSVNWESDREGSSIENDLTTEPGLFSHPRQIQAVQCPESQPHHNMREVPQSLLVLNDVHSAMHKDAPSSARRPYMQFNSNAEVSRSRSDDRNNNHLYMAPASDRKLSGTELNAVKEAAHITEMLINKSAPTPGIEKTTDQMKYLSMLQKQIKLYRLKDKATRNQENTSTRTFTMQNNALLNAVSIPATQGDRNIVQSSCFNLEKSSQDSNFKNGAVRPPSSEIYGGSLDFNKSKLYPLEMAGNVHNLISKKKALEQKRVSLRTVESNRDDQGASFISPDSVICRNSADEHPGSNAFQRIHMNENRAKAELNPIRSGKVIGKPGTIPQQLACSMKYDADAGLSCSGLVNSAEDIVNSWTLMKNERQSQLRKDHNSSVSVTPPSVENWKSSASFAQTDAENFQASLVHVAPTVDDNCEKGKYERQFKKSVSFSDDVALIAGTEEVPSNAVDYVEYVTSFLRKRTNGLKSIEVTDDRSSQTGSSSRGSLLSGSRSDSSGSRTNSNVSMPESSASSGDRDSDFYENDGSMCSEEDSEGTMVDETGRIRCSLCHKHWIDTSEVYCKDCSFYMSKFQLAA